MKWSDKKPYIYGMLAGFGAIALSVLFFFVIYRYRGFSGALNNLLGLLAPFFYGAGIAYLLKPVCNVYDGFLQRHLPAGQKKLAKGLAVAGSLITALLIIYLLFIMVIPQVVDSILTLVNTLPGQVDKWVQSLDQFFSQSPELQSVINTIYENISDTINEWFRTTLVPATSVLISGVGLKMLNALVVIKDLIIGLIVAVYLLMSRHKFSRQARLVLYSVVRRDWGDRILAELHYADKMFEGFINGKLLDSLIIGLICYVFTLLFGVKNALLISVIIGVTNIIPFFGPFIGAIPSILLILIDSPIKALWFSIFVLVLQQFDGNILGPKILGDTTGLSSFWVLFAILLFGGMWGFIGMIVGVPLFAVIYDIFRKLVLRGLHRNQCDDMLERYHAIYGSDSAPSEPAKTSDAS